MMYLGGKSKIAGRIASVIREHCRASSVWDACCGGLSVACALSEFATVYCSDFNRALVALYRGVASGWSIPTDVTEEQYRLARELDDDHPFKAFAGFGCSFGGKWFAGYARHQGRNHAAESARALMRDVPKIQSFHWIDILEMEPRPMGSAIYFDPPYRGSTTEYKGVPRFDHERFYVRVQQWARFTQVFVSEYEMPFGRVLDEIPHRVSVGQKQHSSIERLYGIW